MNSIPDCVKNNAADTFVKKYSDIIYTISQKFVDFNNYDISVEENYWYLMGELTANNMRRLKKYDGSVQFTTYLSRIAINLLTDKNKSQLKGKRIPQYKELNQLPEPEQEIFRLHFSYSSKAILHKVNDKYRKDYRLEDIKQILNKINRLLGESQIKKINKIKQQRQGVLSLNFIFADDKDSSTIIDFLPDIKSDSETVFISKQIRGLLNEILNKAELTSDEKLIIIYFYIDNLKGREIVKLFDNKYSKADIYNMKNKVIKKLSDFATKNDYEKKYLELLS